MSKNSNGMKILVITQAVDRNDTTLGFFHRWIEEFSKRTEKVEVICLRKGEYDLPRNVSVYSLGKEKGSSYLKRIILFFYYSLFCSSYDAVFVHMNQEYVLLGGLMWRIWGKKVFLWRNHPHGDMWTRIAISLSNKVFCTSSNSFTAQFAKTSIMPAGIDTAIFQKNPNVFREKKSLLMFGRISPIKKIEVAIDALVELRSKGMDAHLAIIGDTASKDAGYLETLKDRAEMSGVGEYIHFEKGVPFLEAPTVYGKYELFLNFTPSGSFDKTVIEALACGSKVLVSNQSMKNALPDGSLTNGVVDDVVKKIESLFSLSEAESILYNESSVESVRKQSLDTLMDKLFSQFIS
jgi:glycosyltransferase involved in cell wall biosynthesis